MYHVREQIHWDVADQLGFTGKHITIAYLDTGITFHKDFTTPRSRLLYFRDFVHGRTYPYDDHGHGTHTTGIAASSTCGIAPDSNIISLKVLNHRGHGKMSNIVHCFQWILSHYKMYKIRIVNISIGMETLSGRSASEILLWVNRLWNIGLIVCISAGNLGPEESSITVPGTSHKVITVGSCEQLKLSSYSSHGPTEACVVKPDLVAPGKNVLSCYKLSDYTKRSGTSMATPVVSGAIALYLEKYPASTNKHIKLKLRSSCDDLGYPPNQQGWGRINLKKLLSD